LLKGAVTKAERSPCSAGGGYLAHGTSTRYLGGSSASKFTIQKQHNLSKVSEDEEEENLLLRRLQAQQHRGAQLCQDVLQQIHSRSPMRGLTGQDFTKKLQSYTAYQETKTKPYTYLRKPMPFPVKVYQAHNLIPFNM
jgi:hypothetical protein